jgi:hypothetical protein
MGRDTSQRSAPSSSTPGDDLDLEEFAEPDGER